MDKASIEKQLSGLLQRHSRRSNRRRLMVYAKSLDKNFELINPSGRLLPPGLKLELASDGIRTGWAKGATVWPRKVNLAELRLMVRAHLWRTTA